MQPFEQFGFYGLPGHTATPRDLLQECRDAERLGLGTVFISERYDVKEAATLTGAAAAVTEYLGIATGVTNHNTRHPLVTASWATTMQKLSGGRFSLGLGRGFDFRFDMMGVPRVNLAQLEDFAGLMRRLWSGEQVIGHDGPAGKYGYLSIPSFALGDPTPLLLAALGPRTIEFGGRVMDGVVLHTFFSDDTLARCVALVKRGAEQAGRDPSSVKVWSVLAVMCDMPEETRLKYLVGRMATYLQAYGDALIGINGWDAAVLSRFRADETVRSMLGPIDAIATREQLEYIETLIPAEWLAASAVGDASHCAKRIQDQLDAGATGVILHASTPNQLAPVLEAYAKR